ncbi:hypothetical protein [Pseudomonas baltica]|uniref:hypothetical protein n=1 Tax=Pseudomonas baltica TaxID=2762576 RepID=UPI0028993EB5|nr:hypothetical protein [Pseudomonas baltica]
MFWKRNDPIRVELINAPTIIAESKPAANERARAPEKNPSIKFLTWDQFFKLVAVMVAFANTALVALGYMRYVGVLDPFEISRTEVSFSVSDLLAFGYIGFLNMTFSGQLAVAATASGLAMPIAALVLRFMNGLHALLQLLLSWSLSMVLFFLLTGPYWFAYDPMKQKTLSQVAAQLKVNPDSVGALAVEQEVWTESGFIGGIIVLAMPDTTYLLRDDILYKIRGSDGKIVRRTHIKIRSKQATSDAKKVN